MLFSIVIPVYNVEKYLEECLQSILYQVGDIESEILLIDDGSTDNSGKLCDLYKEKFPKLIKVFHKENEGLLATRRYGFKRASGDYIINCDSDDVLEKNMLKSVKSVILKYNNPDIIFINFNTYDGINKCTQYKNIFSDEHDCKIKKESVLREYLNGHRIASVCGKIVKRTCINIDKDYKEYGRLSTGEDSLQSLEFFFYATSFIYLNEALYNYRCGSGMTIKFDLNYFATFKIIFNLIEKEKYNWDLDDFDTLFAIKVLQTAGRAITQSRYKTWNSYKDQKQYLYDLYNDEMLQKELFYLKSIKNNLQFDHYILLLLLKYRIISLIIVLLNLKNKIG